MLRIDHDAGTTDIFVEVPLEKKDNQHDEGETKWLLASDFTHFKPAPEPKKVSTTEKSKLTSCCRII